MVGKYYTEITLKIPVYYRDNLHLQKTIKSFSQTWPYNVVVTFKIQTKNLGFFEIVNIELI